MSLAKTSVFLWKPRNEVIPLYAGERSSCCHCYGHYLDRLVDAFTYLLRHLKGPKESYIRALEETFTFSFMFFFSFILVENTRALPSPQGMRWTTRGDLRRQSREWRRVKYDLPQKYNLRWDDEHVVNNPIYRILWKGGFSPLMPRGGTALAG